MSGYDKNMTWNLVAVESKQGQQYVEDFFRRLDSKKIAKVMHWLDLLSTHGPRLRMPHAKKITSTLYELRIRGKQEIRILYVFDRTTIYLVHAFIKKSQKIPKKELQLAMQRISHLKNDNV